MPNLPTPRPSRLLATLPLLLLARIVVAAPATWTAGDARLTLQVHPDGTYTLQRNGVEWLTSAPAALHCGGKWYIAPSPSSTASSPVNATPLKPIGKPQEFRGKDVLGAFTGERLTWDAGGTPWVTSFRVYPARSAIVFSQSFPKGAGGMVVTPADTLPRPVGNGTESSAPNCVTVSSAFPSFQITDRVQSLHNLSYSGMFARGQRHVGLNQYTGGTDGGVPLALYDTDLNTLVLSPLNHFKTETLTKSPDMLGTLACGIQGQIERVPAGWTQETILTAGQGIRTSLYDWGSALLASGGKSRTAATRDSTVANLGYWTDNGAYYYYHTEPGKDYEQTLIDARADHQIAHIPFRYYQLDSYWYYKGPDSGIDLWEPRPDVLPDGMAGLQAKLGGDMPLVLHNRWWSKNTRYAKTYPFATDDIAGTAPAPQGIAFWNALLAPMAKAGAKVYEQDWMIDEYEKSIALRRAADAANDWLTDMATAARKAGMTIQYCMPLPADLLTSTTLPAVTQTRLSVDYHPGNDQWQMGDGPLLAWALGLAPFKDTFWTSETEEGTGYGPNTREPNTELQTLVSVLSAGPVGPGDAIGKTDAALLLKTCRADGVLLKPDRPAMPLEEWYLSDFFSYNVQDTQTQIGDRIWHYVLFTDTGSPTAVSLKRLCGPGRFATYDPRSGYISTFDATRSLVTIVPVVFPKPNQPRKSYFAYYALAPLTADGGAFFGETDKFVTVSAQRFRSISTDQQRVTLSGAPGERVTLRWLAPDSPSKVTVNGLAFSESYPDSIPETATGWKYDGGKRLLTVSVMLPTSGEATVLVVKK